MSKEENEVMMDKEENAVMIGKEEGNGVNFDLLKQVGSVYRAGVARNNTQLVEAADIVNSMFYNQHSGNIYFLTVGLGSTDLSIDEEWGLFSERLPVVLKTLTEKLNK